MGRKWRVVWNAYATIRIGSENFVTSKRRNLNGQIGETTASVPSLVEQGSRSEDWTKGRTHRQTDEKEKKTTIGQLKVSQGVYRLASLFFSSLRIFVPPLNYAAWLLTYIQKQADTIDISILYAYETYTTDTTYTTYTT